MGERISVGDLSRILAGVGFTAWAAVVPWSANFVVDEWRASRLEVKSALKAEAAELDKHMAATAHAVTANELKSIDRELSRLAAEFEELEEKVERRLDALTDDD